MAVVVVAGMKEAAMLAPVNGVLRLIQIQRQTVGGFAWRAKTFSIRTRCSAVALARHNTLPNRHSVGTELAA